MIQKQSVPSYDSEQVSLAIYNDISQKASIIQKQNSNSSLKIDNGYDKKLNQFNLKPSVSNVFSSLNEYINAPPGSSDCINSVLDNSDTQSDSESKTIYHINEIPHLIQINTKGNDKSIALKETINITNSTTEPSISNQDVMIPITLELPITYESNIKEDVKNVHLTNLESESEIELSKDVIINKACTELSKNIEIENEESDRMNNENNSMPECTYIQNDYYENESTTKLVTNQESETKLSMENIDIDEHGNSLNLAHKSIGFSNIDDLSEEELTKYLAELEEEEKLRESYNKHENIITRTQNDSQHQKDENKQNVEISTDISIKSFNMIESESSEKENISITDCKKEETSKELLNNILQKQNVQYDDQLNKDIHKDILNNPNNKEIKLLHTANVIKDDKVILENECVPVKNIMDNQEHSIYSLNINQGSLSNDKTEVQLKEQKGNSAQYSQACELKTSNDFDNISEEKVTPEVNVLIDKTSTSLEVYTKPNISDINNESEKPIRPQTLDIVLTNNSNEHQALDSTSDTPSYQVQSDIDGTKEDQGSSPDIVENSVPESGPVLGKQPPFWVPDSDAPSCMLCDVKFTVLKRRHHCRACGKVLCNKCCNMKYKLEYQGNIDSRVCVSCYQLLTKGNFSIT